MIEKVSAQDLKKALHEGSEIALLDVREHGQYGESHLFYAICVPYSRLEVAAVRLVPRVDTRIVVYDAGDDSVATRAAQRLRAIGYTQVGVLAQGVSGWRNAGYELFKGVNVPSKTFGELVELERHTPRLSAQELATRQQAGENLIVLDGRPFEEFNKMAIPGAICCPNGELPLRIGQLVPDPKTTIVINCAGRTRSIIGAQTLINFGVPNPVFALENGTQGWFLAGFELAHGRQARHDFSQPADLALRQKMASKVANSCQVPVLDAASAQALVDDKMRSCFVLDVRTREEFAVGTLAGAQSAPGGQLIQANDQFVGVRQGRLLIVDDDAVRAPMVASWMRQLGFEAYLLAQGIHSAINVPPPIEFSLPTLAVISADELAKSVAANAVAVIDVRSSSSWRTEHLTGSTWSIRPRIAALAAEQSKPIVLMAKNASMAQMAALDISTAGVAMPKVFLGSIDECRQAGLTVQAESAPATPDVCIDYLFFVHDRHDGNREASRRYIEWETGLLAQLDQNEKNGFKVASLVG